MMHYRGCYYLPVVLFLLWVSLPSIFPIDTDRIHVAISTFLDQSQQQSWDCERTWPKITVLLPVFLAPHNQVTQDHEESVADERSYFQKHYHRNHEWYDVFLRSMMAFWPFRQSNTSLHLILDLELHNSTLVQRFVHDKLHKLRKHLLHQTPPLPFPDIQVQYDVPRFDIYATPYDRQEFLMFYPDNFTSSDTEFVAFADTDAAFLSFVDREDLFRDNKPIIHGRHEHRNQNKMYRPSRQSYTDGTYSILGLEEPMVGMSYFPVLIKRAHFQPLRQFITERFKADSFPQAFAQLQKKHSAGHYCQFCIFVTYLWWHYRDEYFWVVHDSNPEWDGIVDAPPHTIRDKSRFIQPLMRLPLPYVANHLQSRNPNKYNTFRRPIHDVQRILAQGICHIIDPAKPSNFSTHYLSAPVKHHSNTEHGHSHVDVAHRLFFTQEKIESFRCTKSVWSYNHEQHFFEDADMNKHHVTNTTWLEMVHRERNRRISQCQHTFVVI